MNTCKALAHGWSFTQLTDAPGVERATKDGEWIPTHAFPTTVHVELLELKKVPDPVRSLFSALARRVSRGKTVHRAA
jgi:beta-mannosidase